MNPRSWWIDLILLIAVFNLLLLEPRIGLNFPPKYELATVVSWFKFFPSRSSLSRESHIGPRSTSKRRVSHPFYPSIYLTPLVFDFFRVSLDLLGNVEKPSPVHPLIFHPVIHLIRTTFNFFRVILDLLRNVYKFIPISDTRLFSPLPLSSACSIPSEPSKKLTPISLPSNHPTSGKFNLLRVILDVSRNVEKINRC